MQGEYDRQLEDLKTKLYDLKHLHEREHAEEGHRLQDAKVLKSSIFSLPDLRYSHVCLF